MTGNLNVIFDEAARLQLTDIFLQEGKPPHGRISGSIVRLSDDPMAREDLLSLWQAVGKDPDGEGEYDVSLLSPSGYRYRANIHRHLGTLGAALRPIKTNVPEMLALGLPQAPLESWCGRTNGIVLISGATGSGKSTSAAAMLEHINQTASKHLVTIEDPIEYVINPARSIVTQREVGTDTDSFNSGLRASLRQNPNVIFLGEIRDSETARIALQAAETGHLVIATMHASDSVDTLERFMLLLPPEEKASSLMVLSHQLISVLSQKLLPKVDGGLFLATERVENVGAVSQWVRDGELSKISEFMERDSGENVRFEKTVFEAFSQGLIDETTARAGFKDPSLFDRIRSGIR